MYHCRQLFFRAIGFLAARIDSRQHRGSAPAAGALPTIGITQRLEDGRRSSGLARRRRSLPSSAITVATATIETTPTVLRFRHHDSTATSEPSTVVEARGLNRRVECVSNVTMAGNGSDDTAQVGAGNSGGTFKGRDKKNSFGQQQCDNGTFASSTTTSVLAKGNTSSCITDVCPSGRGTPAWDTTTDNNVRDATTMSALPPGHGGGDDGGAGHVEHKLSPPWALDQGGSSPPANAVGLADRMTGQASSLLLSLRDNSQQQHLPMHRLSPGQRSPRYSPSSAREERDPNECAGGGGVSIGTTVAASGGGGTGSEVGDAIGLEMGTLPCVSFATRSATIRLDQHT